MPFGLKDNDYKLIKNVFHSISKIEEVIVFGSRAMGTEKPGSDVDLALIGNDITLNDILKLKHKLEELPIIYDFDVINYHTINTPALTEHIDRHGILFYKKEIVPSEWKTYKLGEDVVTKLGDGLHGTPIYDDNGEYYFINGSNLVDGKIVINSNTKRVTKEEFIKYKKDLSNKTILLGINGTIGNVALYNNEMCILGKSAAYLNINDDFDKQFVRYVLTNDHFQNYIKNNASGTTIKNVGLGLLRDYEFFAPENKEEQQQIAQILTSLDDKIELNLQMNQTLEAMAQAIFKEWFVDFNFLGFDGELEDGLPKGWRKEKLENSIVIKNGYAFKGNDFIENGTPVIKIKNVKPNRIILNSLSFVSEEVAKRSEKYIIKKNTLLITMSGNRIDGTPDTWVGKVALFQEDEKYLLNQRVSALEVKSDNYLYYFAMLLSSDDFQNYFITNATSSGGQANISPTLIYNTEVVIPSENILSTFSSNIKHLFEKIQENNNQIQTLTQTRDSLLPRLMSGKIKV